MGKDTRFAALVLAAGYANRRGEFEPLLPSGYRLKALNCVRGGCA